MAIILNEFSLTGQFKDLDSFYHNLKEVILIIRSIKNYNIEILKSYNFYNSNITQTNVLNDLLKNKNEEIRGLKSEISKIINDPFWEASPKHNCSDTYNCLYTNLNCMYGLAEAVENIKTVISFKHLDFSLSPINVNKNNNSIAIDNIYDVDSLIVFLTNNVDNVLIPYVENSLDYLPNKKLTDSLLKFKDVENSWKGISHEEQIASYKKWGNIVAKFNFWRLNNVITNRNDRDIFSKQVNNRTCYLSIDTENGTFELFNHNGNHLGEFNFRFERTQNIRTHAINLH